MDILKLRSMLSQGKSIYDLPLRVTYYARVSTELEQQLNSLDSQVMYYENLIKSVTNWTFVKGYVDEGISGASVKKRDDFLRMIRDAKMGCFDFILTKEVSRFARDTLDSIQYTRELLLYGIGVFFETDNINTLDPDAELRLTIMSSLAQEELRKLSERVKFGNKRSVEKGRVSGSSNILGYKKDNGKLVIVPEEAEIIKKIYELYVYDNIGTTKLSHKLFEEYGYTNSKGNPIHASNIRDIIRNPKYKGYYCANKGETIDFRTKKRKLHSKDEWILYRDNENVPQIVDEELWNQANEKIDARGKKHSADDKSVYTGRFPLSGKLQCSHDGCTYIRGNWKLKNGKRIYWGCDTYRRNGKAKSNGCNSPLLYEDELVQAFRPIIRNIIDDKESILEEINTLLNEASHTTNYQNEKSKISKQIIEVEKQKDNLFMMRSSNEISSEEFAEFRNKFNSKINALNEAFDKIVALEENAKTSFESVQSLRNVIESITIKNDDSVLSIVSSLFEKIIVETNHTNTGGKKAVLHCQLKIEGDKRYNLPLQGLTLLFKSNERFCGTKWH
jgi:site-specific DNA recombinase